MSALSEDMSFLNLMEANEEDENHKPIAFDKGSKLEAYLGGGCCMFVFVLSSILWIILFRSLALKNARVRELVYDIPTLGIYHDKYNDFFHLYDQERDRVLAANTVLQSENMEGFNKAKEKVATILTNLDAMNGDLK